MLKKMSLLKKIVLFVVSAAAIVILIIGLYRLVHYKLYNEYKDSKLTYDVEEGKPFQAQNDSDPLVEGMVLAAENETLKLYTNTETAAIAIVDKRNGAITYSNPPEAEFDPLASPINKSLMQSQLVVGYINTSHVAATYNSYDQAVAFGQVEIESLENGIRYIYTLGDLSSPTGIVPVYITADRLKKFTDKMSEEDAKFVNMRYVESGEGKDLMELIEAAQTGASTLRKMNKYFEGAGYTQDDYEADMADSGIDGIVPMSFVIALEYRLDGDSLVVNVPTSMIEENGGSKIATIQVLRYFGAAGTDEEGYMLVPNGSGSLIYFNNGKTNVQDYAQYMYGIDPLASENLVVENASTARLPVFGIQRESSGIFVSIENGESLALLTASVSGKLNSYNYVYSEFSLRNTSKLSMFGATGSEADLPIAENDIYDVDIQMRYSFLTDDSDGYAGMANYFRNRLIENGVLEMQEESSIPMYLDIIGGVKKYDYFLGIQYLKTEAMTTFEQAAEIAEQFSDAEVSNLVMNYQGWFNGGYYHDVADKITGLSKLGGKSDFEDLGSLLESNGGKLYADVAFEKVTYISKRYDYLRETARYYAGGRIASFGQVNPATLTNLSSLFYIETLYDLLSPKFLPRYVSAFAKDIQDYDITGISLRDLGDTLYSDKKRTEFIDREYAKQIVIDQLDTLSETGKDLMINDGNFYSLPYADDLINIATSANTYYSIDEEIPFYEMVLHGCISYCGESINLSDTFDQDEIVLHLIEYGAAPHFTFTYSDSSELKYTGLNRFYSTSYSVWMDEATAVYSRTNEVLRQVSGSTMTGHEILADGIKKITYSNGIIIYINTTDADFTVDQTIVKAKSYVMEGGSND